MKAKPTKDIVYKTPELMQVVSQTCQFAADIVGSTLGPQGKVVLIERSENLPPFATKDGITVFQSLTLPGSVEQVVLEALRDSSSRTNAEAGDGTTTATILANALIQNGIQLLNKRQDLSYQKIMRDLEILYKLLENLIQQWAQKPTNTDADQLLYNVALVASNHDAPMAQAVLDAFNLVGHNGHVTILEGTGSGYEVDKIDGFHIARGLEDSAGRYADEFINDKSNYRVVLERPRFLLYNGKLSTLSSVLPAIEKIGEAYEIALQNGDKNFSPNIILVAHSFSDEVLAQLGYNFKNPATLNIYPLKTVMTPQTNSPYHFLVDLSAFTGATIFDPLTRPLTELNIDIDLGLPSMHIFESSRYKSLLLGIPDESRVLLRVSELEQQMEQAETALDKELYQERIGILTGGIAKIKVKGVSEAELKEKRHRVEDAVLAVKGAVKYGVLPGAGKIFIKIANELEAIVKEKQINVSEESVNILTQSLLAPFYRLLYNGGMKIEEIKKMHAHMLTLPEWHTYDAIQHRFGHALEIGVIDSAAAVLLSLKNAIGVAKILMGLSAVIAYKRDNSFERQMVLKQMEQEHDLKKAEKEIEAEKYWLPSE